MRIIRSPKQLKKVLSAARKKSLSVGFVPTMGYLHEGHLSLVRRSKKQNDLTVVSIFVNPLQFGPKEDLSRYPRDLGRDSALLSGIQTDILFLPAPKDLYSKNFQTAVSVGSLAKGLCGKTRPTHFAGVATVVAKLLNIVSPDRMYLGQKDYQQCRVVEQMVLDLDMPAKIVRVPITREPDGVAMSSRNVFLSPEERGEAVSLNRSLKTAELAVKNGIRDVSGIRRQITKILRSLKTGRVDYAEIVDSRTLEPVVKLKAGTKIVVALAVFFSKARLIDNKEIKVP